jgi:RNA polymerase-binding protein DksA
VPKKAAAKQAPAKQVPAKKAAAKQVPAKKAAAKQAPAKQVPAKKAAAKRTASRRAPATKAPAKKAAAATAPAGRTPAKKTPVKKTAPKKTVAKKTAVRRTARAGKAAADKAAAAQAAPESPAGKATAKKTGARKVAAKKPVAQAAATSGSPLPATRIAAEPGELAVLPGEDPWTPEEVEEARAELLAEVERLGAEIASSEAAVAGLLRDSGDGAGDEADTGTKNITREYEMALAANTREMLTQTHHALQRLDEGTYGRCEVCGNPIGKARMQAFPRATLCLDDKQKQERR